MSKRPLGHGDIRRMSDFKATAIDYTYYLTLLDEGRLYCLTDRQIYILLTQLDYVGWLTRWYNTEDITQTEVGFIRSELELALLSCVDISILVDQGKLNLTRSVQQQQIESQALRDIYQDRYDGSPTSINPNAPTDNFGDTGDRYDALCAALMAFVYQFAKGQIEALIAGDIAAFALLVGAALLLIPGLNLFYIAGAALFLAGGIGIIGVTTEVAIAALSDSSALDQVVCYMRDTLKDQDVTQENFETCLDSYPFTVGSYPAIVADFLKATLSQNYLPFLDMLGQAYSGILDGQTLPSCPCDEGWSKTFNFALGDEGWTINVGAYTAAVGIQNPGSGGFPYTVDLSLGVTWPSGSALTTIDVEASSTTADAGAFRGVYYPGTANPAQTGYTGNTGDYTMSFIANNANPPTIAAQVSNNMIPGTNIIKSITLTGTGPEPSW